jgi:hypothetical protein
MVVTEQEVCVVLNDHEQRTWEEIERSFPMDAEEPARAALQPGTRRRSSGRAVEDLPAPVVAGVWIAILVILLGAPLAGLAVGAATAAGWLVWRSWPVLRGADVLAWSPVGGLPVSGEVDARGDAAAPPPERL